ncbi:STAS/SEC14 domain-containing protein [Rubritalea spongiae]|uniref:STAS/SEC14 domain-containing protein n=1 Tax=Rubritalea spongiae TaxID=430797 RepID=A0ABW5E5Q6_9BACT
MLTYKIFEDRGLVEVEPKSKLTAADFKVLTESVDDYLEKHLRLHGLIIYTQFFPGWEDWDAFMKHLCFVKNHHEEIEKVALVTDAKIGTLGESLGKHFISAEIKHFAYKDYERALMWF